jgi:hypothetical protein
VALTIIRTNQRDLSTGVSGALSGMYNGSVEVAKRGVTVSYGGAGAALSGERATNAGLKAPSLEKASVDTQPDKPTDISNLKTGQMTQTPTRAGKAAPMLACFHRKGGFMLQRRLRRHI